MKSFPRLFEAGKIGKLALKNRIIMPPMVTGYATQDGLVSDKLIKYYATRAEGGCGLVTVEACLTHLTKLPNRISLGYDEVIPGLKRLVDAIHKGGAKASIQVNPHRARLEEGDAASSSEGINPWNGTKARGLSTDEIWKLEDLFASGVKRAYQAGFDCIMIHGASGYLVSEFLSPRVNKRTDAYGGDRNNRCRFALELLERARDQVGANTPIIFRLCGDERLLGGFGPEESTGIAKIIEQSGVDAIDVVSGSVESIIWSNPTSYMPRACNASLSDSIKKAVTIPVSVAGRIGNPMVAEQVLSEGKADFIDMGRGLIADPALPAKAKAGKESDIRMCIACGRCLEERYKTGGPLICTVNPAVGTEKEFEAGLKKASNKKKVLVIGGGPAGMETAMLAAQRGHKVELWEKDARLGGQLNLAVVPPKKEELLSLITYFPQQLKRLKVPVRLNKQATRESVSKFSPDTVVVAAGSNPMMPQIPGMEKKNAVSFAEVLNRTVNVGNKVVVVGGGFVGCETACFLADQGKTVTIVEMLPMLASELFILFAFQLIGELNERKVVQYTGVKSEIITEAGMEITDKDGNKVLIEADDIIMAIGSRSDTGLSKSLENNVPELHVVGDCAKVCRIWEAIREGANIAMQL